MRAVQFDKYGGSDVLYVADVERPQVATGKLLVKVRAAALTSFGYKVREGLMEAIMPIRFPRRQGSGVKTEGGMAAPPA